MEYKISVVVPVYRTEQYFKETLESLIEQTIQPLEIIIVNDVSTDQSPEIIEEYASNHPHIKVIHQEHAGFASACHAGIKLTSGKYIIIADSNIIPRDAYEKLFLKAEEADADIVIGKVHLLIDGMEKEYPTNHDIWEKERVLTSVREYLDLFYNSFYTNKLFKQTFLKEQQCFLPEAMIDAGRLMVHKAFLVAQKIAIIPDVVSLWREHGDNEDLTQEAFKDQIRSYQYQLEDFTQFGDSKLKSEFLKRQLSELLLPLEGILQDPDFRDLYVKEVKSLFKQVEEIYHNGLSIKENLYIYMIQNDLITELLQLLAGQPTGEVHVENGKAYWASEFFRHSAIRIPDELFEVKHLETMFIKITEVTNRLQKIHFSHISVPNTLPIQKAQIKLQAQESFKDQHIFELIRETKNDFFGEISFENLNQEYTYDIYLLFYLNDKVEKFLITPDMCQASDFAELNQKIKYFQLSFSKQNQLSLVGLMIAIQAMEADETGLRMQIKQPPLKGFSFSINGKTSREICPFTENKSGCYELSWDALNETDELYDLYYLVSGIKYRIKREQVKSLKGFLITQEERLLASFITKDNHISIGVTPPIKMKELMLTKDKIHVFTNHNARSLLEFYLVDRSNTKKTISFDQNADNQFECKTRHLLKKNTVFDLFYKIFGHKVRVHIDHIARYQLDIVNKDHSFIELYETVNQNLSFRATYLSPIDSPKITRKKLMVSTGRVVPKTLKFFIKDTATGADFYLNKTGVNRYELEWTEFPLNETTYDWYFEFYHHAFQLEDLFIDDFIPSFRTEPAFINLYESKPGKISIEAAPDISIHEWEMNETGIVLTLDQEAHESMSFFLKDRLTREAILFEKITSTKFTLSWDSFLKENKEYDFYFEIFNKEVRLNAAKVKVHPEQIVKLHDLSIEAGQTFKNDLFIKSYTFWSKMMRKFK
ncbi:glycosyltransferase family 2 protein [Cytobacillus sp. Hz8]|uniref:glycosyltransferase family 2 protein n=1 Tax=Cytobacillus sp. Hz8 TaxID=3347168 RepID=UPI0035D7D9E3